MDNLKNEKRGNAGIFQKPSLYVSTVWKNFMGGTTSSLFDEKPNGTQLQYLGNKQKGKKDGLGNNVDYFQY